MEPCSLGFGEKFFLIWPLRGLGQRVTGQGLFHMYPHYQIVSLSGTVEPLLREIFPNSKGSREAHYAPGLFGKGKQ